MTSPPPTRPNDAEPVAAAPAAEAPAAPPAAETPAAPPAAETPAAPPAAETPAAPPTAETPAAPPAAETPAAPPAAGFPAAKPPAPATAGAETEGVDSGPEAAGAEVRPGGAEAKVGAAEGGAADGGAADGSADEVGTAGASVGDGREGDERERAEVDRLRGEVAALRAELSTRRQRRSILDAARRIIAAVCVMLAAFALVASVVGVWAARTVLDTDRWVAAVAPLPEDPAVATAVAQYSTDQLFEVLDVETRLREALPPRAGFVIGPLTVQLRGVIRTQVLNIVSSERFQTVWEEANRRAHQRALAIIEGRSTLITASDDQVRIDLLPLINQVLQRIETQLPTFFGRSLSLPDLRSGEIPPNLRERIETALGVSLPANFAQFTVYDAGRLRAVQETVVAVRQGLIALVLGAIALLLIALAIAPRRRRTLLQLGIWLAVAAVAVTAVLRAARAELLQQVPDGVYRDGVAATLTIVTAPLRDRGLLVIAAGVLIALVAYLVGPGRVPVALRRGIARGTRSAGRGTARGGRWLAAHGPGWIRRYRDPLRIGGAVVAALAVILVSSWSGLLVIVVLLVVYEVAVTLIARSPSETVPTEPRPPQTESPAPARG